MTAPVVAVSRAAWTGLLTVAPLVLVAIIIITIILVMARRDGQ